MTPTVPVATDGFCKRDDRDKESRTCTSQKKPSLKSQSCSFLSNSTWNRDWMPSPHVTKGRYTTLGHRSISALEQLEGSKQANYSYEHWRELAEEHRLRMTPPDAGQRHPTQTLLGQDAVPKTSGVAPSAEAIRGDADELLKRLYTVLSGDKNKMNVRRRARRTTHNAARTQPTAAIKPSTKEASLRARTRVNDEQSPESPTHVEGLCEFDVKDVWQSMDTPEQPLSPSRFGKADVTHLPEWAWPFLLNRHVVMKLRVDSFLKSGNASVPFHRRKTQEALRFYDDALSAYPVHILRLEHDSRLTLNIITHNSPLTIEKITSISVKAPDEEFVELEMAQRVHEETVEATAFLQPSKFKSRRMHEISPHFGSVDRKYVKLTVKLRLLLNPPFSREVDMHHCIYCKITHPRAKLRLHRLLGMFENQARHNVYA